MFLQLSNVKCGGCVSAVKQALAGIDGISDVEVSLPDGVLKFNVSEAAKIDEIKDRLKTAGYPAV